jgi:hypothetical protein
MLLAGCSPPEAHAGPALRQYCTYRSVIVLLLDWTCRCIADLLAGFPPPPDRREQGQYCINFGLIVSVTVLLLVIRLVVVRLAAGVSPADRRKQDHQCSNTVHKVSARLGENIHMTNQWGRVTCECTCFIRTTKTCGNYTLLWLAGLAKLTSASRPGDTRALPGYQGLHGGKTEQEPYCVNLALIASVTVLLLIGHCTAGCRHEGC